MSLSYRDTSDAEFNNHLAMRIKIKTEFHTNLTDAYKPSWSCDQAIRELIQNLLDGIRKTFRNKHNKLLPMKSIKVTELNADNLPQELLGTTSKLHGGWNLHVEDDDEENILMASIFSVGNSIVLIQNKCVLTRTNLFMGSDKKPGGDYAGYFGEGFKVAALVLLSNGYNMTYKMHEENWIFELKNIPCNIKKELVVTGVETPDKISDLVTVIDCPDANLAMTHLDTIQRTFILLDRSSFGKIYSTGASMNSLLKTFGDRDGSVYVQNMLVTNSPVLKAIGLACNFASTKCVGGRDRTFIKDDRLIPSLINEALAIEANKDLAMLILDACEREGRGDQASAYVSMMVMRTEGMVQHIEKYQASQIGTDKIFLLSEEDSNKKSLIDVLKNIGSYVVIPSGWLRPSIPMNDIITKLIIEQESSEPDKFVNHWVAVKAINELCAKFSARNEIELVFWKTPKKFEKFEEFQKVYLTQDKMYVPSPALYDRRRSTVLFASFLHVFKSAYPDVVCVRDIVEFFAQTLQGVHHPNAEKLEEFYESQAKGVPSFLNAVEEEDNNDNKRKKKPLMAELEKMKKQRTLNGNTIHVQTFATTTSATQDEDEEAEEDREFQEVEVNHLLLGVHDVLISPPALSTTETHAKMLDLFPCFMTNVYNNVVQGFPLNTGVKVSLGYFENEDELFYNHREKNEIVLNINAKTRPNHVLCILSRCCMALPGDKEQHFEHCAKYYVSMRARSINNFIEQEFTTK